MKYADVVSGGEVVTMMVRLGAGREATVQNTFMVLKNSSRSYPIRGVPDDRPRISYREVDRTDGWTRRLCRYGFPKKSFSLYETCERELCMWIIAAAIIKKGSGRRP